MSRSPRYDTYKPASKQASEIAKSASKKCDTRPETILRKALWQQGYRYRKNVSWVPGKPDIVFVGARVAIFCDGDFWHGKDWDNRREKLHSGHNSEYWIAKIERNIERDQEVNNRLKSEGWQILRFWESDIKHDLGRVLGIVVNTLQQRS